MHLLCSFPSSYFILTILFFCRYHPIARKMIEADMKKENDYDSTNEETISSLNISDKESLYSCLTSPSSIAIAALVAATSILVFYLRNKIE